MLEKNKQAIEGDSNIIAGGDVHNHYHYGGITEEEVREIALATVRKELEVLSGQAKTAYVEMVNRITDNVIRKILDINPEKLNEFSNPSTQLIVHEMLSSVCKFNDEDIEDAYVDLMLDYIMSDPQSFERKIDEEAIQVLGKLNVDLLYLIHTEGFFMGLIPKSNKDEDIVDFYISTVEYYTKKIYKNSLEIELNEMFNYLEFLNIFSPFEKINHANKSTILRNKILESAKNLDIKLPINEHYQNDIRIYPNGIETQFRKKEHRDPEYTVESTIRYLDIFINYSLTKIGKKILFLLPELFFKK